MQKRIHGENPYKELQNTLKAQCESCCGLCCTALYFSKSEGFPENKDAGKPCKNLQDDFQCRIHSELQPQGLKGCLSYDCFGAGQVVTQDIYKGLDWKQMEPKEADYMFQVFVKVYQLRQMLWYLVETASFIPAGRLKSSSRALIADNQRMIEGSAEAVGQIDVEEYKARVNKALRASAECVQKSLGRENGKKQGSEYMGRSFKRQDLSGHDFSMALLIAADLRGCQMAGVNFLGADLRDARLDHADLRDSLFLTQMQINEARGNRSTRLPDALVYPDTWA